MEGLTFYKLKSPYKDDYTKNCALQPQEVDKNFLTLKDYDIQTAYWEKESQTLILVRNNGDLIKVSGITEGCTKDLVVDYDADNGTLTVTNNGSSTILTGFTGSNALSFVYSDDTISGKGNKQSPLGVSSIAQTGVYKPAIRLIDTTIGEVLPQVPYLTRGNRYVTLEKISDYGLLYNFDGVKNIMTDLACQGGKWRVASKEDWDGMLNAIEPCAEDRNHETAQGSRYLGKFAGKLLKTVDYWKLESPCPPYPPCPPCNCNDSCGCDCNCNSENTFSYVLEDSMPSCTCEAPNPNLNCGPRPPFNPHPNRGVNAYGFGVMPAGYGDGNQVMAYFGERSFFWTTTQSHGYDVYAKRFDYNRSSVYQEIVNPKNLFSIRLVKDYDGTNFNARERINGMEYSTVLMPDARGGHKIWTATNVAFTNRHYCGVEPNRGLNLVFSEKYFVNEWDGFKWLKNEIKEGESIVLLNALNGQHNLEYRVINGALTSTGDAVYEEVIKVVQPQLDAINAQLGRIKTEVINLSSKIDNEINRSIEADTNLDNKIDAEIQRAIKADTDLDSKIDAETQRSIEADTNLDNKITAEIQRATEADINLDKKINDEAQRATEAEINLNNKIDAEAQRATEAEINLNNKIDAEAQRATEAEINLDKKIDTEIQRATEADTNLDAKIDAETQRSIEADTNLDNKITAETERAIENEKQIIGRLISKTGSVYSLSEGKLTLATENAENTITIDLDGNYGTF